MPETLDDRLRYTLSDGESIVTFTPEGDGYGCKVNDLLGYGDTPQQALDDALAKDQSGPGESKRKAPLRDREFGG